MIVNGWLDWATRRDGIPDKIYSEPNAGLGIACHSVVGREREFEDGIPNRFLSTERGADGRYTWQAAASCMFVLRESGELIQMYPVTASTWTSGGHEGNTRFWAIEAEGGLYPNYGEQLTPEASDTFVRLVTEWEAYSGIAASPNVNILQHRQIAAMFGYAPTACASGRYDEAWARISAGERFGDMANDDDLLAMFSGSEEADLSREERLKNARYRRDEIAAGSAQSVNDRSTSAITLSKRAIAAASALALAMGAAGSQVADILGGLQ